MFGLCYDDFSTKPRNIVCFGEIGTGSKARRIGCMQNWRFNEFEVIDVEGERL